MTDLQSLTRSARKIIPHFPSRDILATIQFYRDALHFTCGEPQNLRENKSVPSFVSVCIGAQAAANIYFFLDPDQEQWRSGKAMIAMSNEGLEGYYNLLKWFVFSAPNCYLFGRKMVPEEPYHGGLGGSAATRAWRAREG